MNCPVCRGLLPIDCPGCGVVDNIIQLKPANDNHDSDQTISEQDIMMEMFRDIGEDRDYDYYPGCYEG